MGKPASPAHTQARLEPPGLGQRLAHRGQKSHGLRLRDGLEQRVTAESSGSLGFGAESTDEAPGRNGNPHSAALSTPQSSLPYAHLTTFL